MKIAIHQPNYLPYPGFFAKARLCDVFVLYDTAQFTRGDYINRNKIRTGVLDGWKWLTLPVGKKRYRHVSIRDVTIKDDRIFDRHEKTLDATYSGAPFFDEELCTQIGVKHVNLAEHNLVLLQVLLEKLGIKPRLVRSSELDLSTHKGTRALVEIIQKLDGDEYISGMGAKDYLDEAMFREASISLYFVDYAPIVYEQMHPGFVLNMSMIDAIFNIGYDAAMTKLVYTTLKVAHSY